VVVTKIFITTWVSIEETNKITADWTSPVSEMATRRQACFIV